MDHQPLKTKGLAIMLYVASKEIGDSFYHSYLEQLGFPRNRYPNAPFYTDYHITIGYLEKVRINDIQQLSDHLTADLSKKIHLEQVSFKFGMPTLLGLPRRPFFAILPENSTDFYKYNLIVSESLQSFKKRIYSLDNHTLPNQYLPHINLYAQVNKHIESKAVAATLEYLRKNLQGKALPLTKIKIH